jgi:glutamate racemase
MSEKPIGVYDSGIGGLTVLDALQQQLPHENFVYFADTAHLPYGNKTPQQIMEYGRTTLTWMQNVAKVKMVVAACHTSSALALPSLRREFFVPIIGAIEPLWDTITKNDSIGIIATPTTATSLMHEHTFRQYGFTGIIKTIGCPDFVPLIEAGVETGQLDATLLHEKAVEYLQPFYDYQLNTLIYGCTHYPLIRSIIEPLLPGIRCIDPADSIAKQVSKVLEKYHMKNTNETKKPSITFACNANQDAFQRKLRIATLNDTIKLRSGRVFQMSSPSN